MPKIEVKENFFYKALGKKYTYDELEAVFPKAKAELDGVDAEKGMLKIELNDTNRPDLWSAVGLARALRLSMGKKANEYDFLSEKGNTKNSGKREFIVDENYPEYRQYSIGFAAEGKSVTEDILEALIQTQEKICSNYGRKRKLIAMGIYKSDMITYPVHYCAADPDTTSFIPLHEQTRMTLREVLTNTQKGREYGHIIQDYDSFPYLKDSAGHTLSLPPVINSSDVGAVEIGDKNLFIEMSGPNLKMLLLASNIVASDLSDMGFTILPVKVKFPYKTEFGTSVTVPYYFQKKTETTLDEAEKLLGIKLKRSEVIKLLAKCGIKADVLPNGVIEAYPPCYRNDLISSVDIIEDIAIARGLESFDAEPLSDFTIGRLQPAEVFARKLRPILVGLGFQEMMYNYLSSIKEYAENMCISDENMIHILNPMSEKFALVRPSIIPSLLKTESLSSHAPYPHKAFEIGKVAVIDKNSSGGTRTDNSFALMSAGEGENYNSISSVVSTIFYFLGKEYTLKEIDDPRFIKGRSASVYIQDKQVGVFGEIHPRVLTAWDIEVPVVVCEFNLDLLL